MEQKTFAAAIHENEERLRAYIARMIGEADAAADLTQETFARAHAAREAFRGDSKLGTWLFAIATNVCLDYLKSSAHRRLKVTPPETLVEIAAGDEDGPRLSAALLHDQAEMGACVRHFIDELPADYRSALLLHDIEGMPNAEVAAALGCTVATAKIRVHRARQKLRALLEQHCTFDRDARNVFVCEPRSPATEPPA
jgi:RNA polymerase sigma-70 factor (ECF subfamily)